MFLDLIVNIEFRLFLKLLMIFKKAQTSESAFMSIQRGLLLAESIVIVLDDLHGSTLLEGISKC